MKYENLLQNLLAPGDAFSFALGKLQTKILAGLAVEFERIDQRAKDLIRETDPRTTSEMLEDWEREYGLPGDCFAGVELSFEERRAAVFARYIDNGENTKESLEQLISAYGKIGTVVDNLDFTFTVTMAEESERILFRSGAGRAGENLLFFGGTTIECVIRELKPAHTIVNFIYEDV